MEKTTEEIVEDFKKLSWQERNVELNLLLDKYAKQSEKNILSGNIGFSKTEDIWHLYRKLRDIQLSDFEEDLKISLEN